MRRNTLIIALFAISGSVSAQNKYYSPSYSDRNGYAVTDSLRNGARWYFLRTIDLSTGDYGRILTPLLTGPDTAQINTANPNFRNGIAAIAYDKRNRRIYFTPLFTDRLSYVDLGSMRVRTVTNQFTGLFPKADDQSNVITRMVITEGHTGYALTNDGNHLVRFSTSGNYTRDLGALIDHHSNGVMSVHNVCSSFGGDIIADDDDNLYLVTAGNHVFKINIRNRVTRYLGTINGLPASFVTSGVAVDPREEKLVLVSSVDASDVYMVDPDRLMAKGLRAKPSRYAADLAGSSTLHTHRHNHDHKEGSELFTYDEEANDKVSLYPNPVTNNQFNIEFRNAAIGSYKAEIIDAKGQLVMAKMITTSGKSSIITITLPESTAKGIFVVKLTDRDGNSICNQKILVQ